MILDIEIETGEVGTSIGTSLAIEGLCGVYPDRPENPPPVAKLSVLWINLETIGRNIMRSADIVFESQFTATWITNQIIQEIDAIDAFISQYNRGVKIVPYYIDQDALSKRYSWIDIREPSEKDKKLYEVLRMGVRSAAYSMSQTVKLPEFNVTLNGNTCVLTHQVMDLATQANRKDLALLESHTGKLKLQNVWHTKMMLNNVEMPFNKLMLSIIGDRNQVIPKRKLKGRLIKLAKANKWNRTTSIDTMIGAASKAKETELEKYLKDYKLK